MIVGLSVCLASMAAVFCVASRLGLFVCLSLSVCLAFICQWLLPVSLSARISKFAVSHHTCMHVHICIHAPTGGSSKEEWQVFLSRLCAFVWRLNADTRIYTLKLLVHSVIFALVHAHLPGAAGGLYDVTVQCTRGPGLGGGRLRKVLPVI